MRLSSVPLVRERQLVFFSEKIIEENVPE